MEAAARVVALFVASIEGLVADAADFQKLPAHEIVTVPVSKGGRLLKAAASER